MAAVELALLLLATVLVSAIFDQIIPRISLPLIQIALGVLIALIAPEQIHITLYPELFLVLFIAPLLFHEAQIADKVSLWKNRTSMLSFAIGLVVMIVLAVGFMVNALVPSIPLAAAFALGAALGPTDPIAVASISHHADIPERQEATLKGESLINDASGIVSFQFAIAAVTTGAFSVGEALLEFTISFFGALILGVIIGYLLVRFADKMRDLGLETTTFHVLLEICTPIIVYLFGELIGVSGVIMVVACGITMSLIPRDLGPAISRMNIVSSSVWEVLTFALNGIVFVLLGTQLPNSLGGIWIDDGIDDVSLLAYILLITAVMHGVRFVWSLFADARMDRKAKKEQSWPERLRSAAILTFAGAKGTITLAIMFSIPNWVNAGAAMERFPHRDLLIFLASGVILISLLLATFVVPLLAPRKHEESSTRERDAQTRIDIFRAVIEELTARQTPETRIATSQVIARYNDRIARVKSEDDIDDERSTDLRLKVLRWEEEYVLELMDRDEIDPIDGYQYLNRVARIATMIRRDRHRSVALIGRVRRWRTILRKLFVRVRNRFPGEARTSRYAGLRDIQLRCAHHIVHKLQDEMTEIDAPTEEISELIVEYQRTIGLLKSNGPSITAIANAAAPDLEVTRMSLRIELEQIQLAYEEKRLSRSAAQAMRENVYLMQIDLEDYI